MYELWMLRKRLFIFKTHGRNLILIHINLVSIVKLKENIRIKLNRNLLRFNFFAGHGVFFFFSTSRCGYNDHIIAEIIIIREFVYLFAYISTTLHILRFKIVLSFNGFNFENDIQWTWHITLPYIRPYWASRWVQDSFHFLSGALSWTLSKDKWSGLAIWKRFCGLIQLAYHRIYSWSSTLHSLF